MPDAGIWVRYFDFVFAGVEHRLATGRTAIKLLRRLSDIHSHRNPRFRPIPYQHIILVWQTFDTAGIAVKSKGTWYHFTSTSGCNTVIDNSFVNWSCKRITV